MTHKLILASAGAGKSYSIIQQALEHVSNGQRVLILTYTENNQKQLINTICQMHGHKPSGISVKGWFTFLLEDMIRPYQRYVFDERIPAIYFNPSDPHKMNGRTIKGRSERLNGTYNSRYFLTESKNLAHTHCISKLAETIEKESKRKATNRLSEIYSTIFIDEVQDLIGWDYAVIGAIAKNSSCNIVCVGDFRQTLYATSTSQKTPRTNTEKLNEFGRIGFVPEHMSISRRCIQQICDFSDLIHANEGHYLPTRSVAPTVPFEFEEHQGIFIVSSSDVVQYLEKYQPTILRHNKVTGADLCDGRRAVNFGESKGLGFDRVLILPTDKHRGFLAGNNIVFGNDDTDKAKNTFYVAVTRARYSVAFLYDGEVALDGVNVWTSR